MLVEFTLHFYNAAIVRHMVANKLGIEIADPEPAAPVSAPQEEPTPSENQQMGADDLPKVFGDEKEGTAADETKEEVQSPAQPKEGESELEPTAVESGKPEEETKSKEETTADAKTEETSVEPEATERKDEESNDTTPVETKSSEEDQSTVEGKESEVPPANEAISDDATKEQVTEVEGTDGGRGGGEEQQGNTEETEPDQIAETSAANEEQS